MPLQPVPYQNLTNGLYLLKQSAEKNGVIIDHYGILDVGNTLRRTSMIGFEPVIIHQTPPRVRLDWLKNTGQWNMIGRIQDIAGAKTRIIKALETPDYDLFGNNCEHFARFVALNRRESPQVFWGTTAVLAVGAVILGLTGAFRRA